MKYPEVCIFPYLSTRSEIEVNGLTFWPLRESWSKYLESEHYWRGVEVALGIYRNYRGEPIVNGIGVILRSPRDTEKFQLAILALKFTLISNRIPFSPIYDDHFHYLQHDLKIAQNDSVVIIEGHHTTIGQPDSLRRQMPGPLHPEWIQIDSHHQTRMTRIAEHFGTNDGVRAKWAAAWFCRAFKWSADRIDRLIALTTALETLVHLPKANEKARCLASKLSALTIDDPAIHSWAETVYKLRNHILHEGDADLDRFIYRDPSSQSNYRVRYHEEIAELIFKGAFERVTNPPGELDVPFVTFIRTIRLLGAISANRHNLEALLSVVGKDRLSPNEADIAMQLESLVVDQDFSLTKKDCLRFVSQLEEVLQAWDHKDFSGFEDTIHRGLQSLQERVRGFHTNLQVGVYSLPPLS